VKRVKEMRDEGGFSPGTKSALALKQVSPLFFCKRPHPLLLAGSRTARGKIAFRGIPN